jgi:hypothetical protein
MKTATRQRLLPDIAPELAMIIDLNAGSVGQDDIKDLQDGTYVLFKRLLYHWTVIRGHIDDHVGYFDRWCYQTEEGARQAFIDFPDSPAASYEPLGWHRHPKTGRRRPEGDPSAEYIDP